MKLNDAVRLGKDGVWQQAQVRLNPGSSVEWFVMLTDHSLKSFMLADTDDVPITNEDLNALRLVIQSLGVKDFTVFL